MNKVIYREIPLVIFGLYCALPLSVHAYSNCLNEFVPPGMTIIHGIESGEKGEGEEETEPDCD